MDLVHRASPTAAARHEIFAVSVEHTEKLLEPGLIANIRGISGGQSGTVITEHKDAVSRRQEGIRQSLQLGEAHALWRQANTFKQAQTCKRTWQMKSHSNA